MSASQHYTDYSDMPVVTDAANLAAAPIIEESLKAYSDLLQAGMPKEEARMVLPNASVVNLLWDVNLRSLLGFLRQRMCGRNVKEMRVFSAFVQCELYKIWPELVEVIGPPCAHGGVCNQGHLSCGHPWRSVYEQAVVE